MSGCGRRLRCPQRRRQNDPSAHLAQRLCGRPKGASGARAAKNAERAVSTPGHDSRCSSTRPCLIRLARCADDQKACSARACARWPTAHVAPCEQSAIASRSQRGDRAWRPTWPPQRPSGPRHPSHGPDFQQRDVQRRAGIANALRATRSRARRQRSPCAPAGGAARSYAAATRVRCVSSKMRAKEVETMANVRDEPR